MFDGDDGVLRRAFVRAALDGEECRPVHVVAALSEVSGPVGRALRPADGAPLVPPGAEPVADRGYRSSYLTMQLQQAARRLADRRGESVGAGHLLVAALDQADPEVTGLLTSRGVDPAVARARTVDLLGGPVEREPIAMPTLTPAGTLDRPPLPIEDLDPRAWRVLSWGRTTCRCDDSKRELTGTYCAAWNRAPHGKSPNG